MSSIISGLAQLSGLVAYAVIAALVFGETAVFLGFVLPGETAAVLGGVLASRGHLSLATLTAVVVVSAVIGPIVGYEIGRRMGDRLFAGRAMRRVPGGPERARMALRQRGGLAVMLGRFVAFVRAVMPAAAGAVRVPYRTFLFYNVAGGLIWGVGYCVLGYLAGSAYAAVERRVGAGLAVAVALVVVAAVSVWTVRRHRAAASGGASRAAASGGASRAAGPPGQPPGTAESPPAAPGAAESPPAAPGAAASPGVTPDAAPSRSAAPDGGHSRSAAPDGGAPDAAGPGGTASPR